MTYATARSLNLCWLCKAPSPDKALCPPCRESTYPTRDEPRKQKRARGECRDCSSPARPGKSACFGCLRKDSLRKQAERRMMKVAV